MRLIIFTEGGDKKGFGHLARCSAIYEAAENQNLNPLMIIAANLDSIPFLQGKNYLLADWNKTCSEQVLKLALNNLVVIDSYTAQVDIYETLAKAAKSCLYFDDDSRIKYPKGLLLNPARNAPYDYNKSLVGAKYTIIRKAFLENRKAEINEEMKNVLVSLGADNNNLTAKIADSLLKKNSKFNLFVVTPSGAKRFECSNKNVEMLHNLSAEEMAKVMKNCDVAISAGGQTALELCCVGTPMVIIETAENQKENVEALIRNNIIRKKLSLSDDHLEKNLFEEVSALSSLAKRMTSAYNMVSFIDGLGANRAVEELINESNYN